MSDELDWNFVDKDDAKAEIRAAVAYLLRGAAGGARGDIVLEIIAIVRDVAKALPPKPTNPLDDDMPGG
jgi:hypothetical protein